VNLQPGRWSEPIRSPYGIHLVWVAERDAATIPALDAVRPRVLRAYRAERRAQYLSRMMDDLHAAYEVRIEHGPRA
jgi:parvulin-like peptidyl-prolyl isomerase